MVENRTFRIKLPGTLTVDERQALQACLSDNPDVVGFTLDETRLMITYQFPRTTRGILWQQIRERVEAYRTGSLGNLVYGLSAYMEANEQKHLLRHTGWQRYVQDVYIRHVHPGDGTSNRRKNWEQYRRSGNPQGKRDT